MANEHLMFAEEPAFGTWTAPDKAVHVRSVNLTGNQPIMLPEETGLGRGDSPGAQGEVSVGPGDVVGLLRARNWGFLLRSAFGTRDVAAAGAGFRNKLLVDDDIDPETFSFQKRFKPTLAESLKGNKLAGFTISARAREFAMISTSWVGKDSVSSEPTVAIATSSIADPTVITTTAPHGLVTGDYVTIAGHTSVTPVIDGTHIVTVTGATTFTIPVNVTADGVGGTINKGQWADGTAAPAVVDPVPYLSPDVEPFKFYQGVLRLGGTVVETDGELVVSGGTARNDLDNIEVSMNLNPSTDSYGVNLGDRTLQDIPLGRREITVRFDPSFGLSGAEFYKGWKNGTKAVIELFFRGPEFEAGFRHEMKITLPWVVYSAGGMPELNAQYGLKRHTVEGRGFIDDTVGHDIGLVIQTTEDLVS